MRPNCLLRENKTGRRSSQVPVNDQATPSRQHAELEHELECVQYLAKSKHTVSLTTTLEIPGSADQVATYYIDPAQASLSIDPCARILRTNSLTLT